MALFGFGDKKKKAPPADATHLIPGKRLHCYTCGQERTFTKCWRRVGPVSQCPCCSHVFEDIGKLYALRQPACPRCEEPLEQPGFEYGLCDTCRSKYEIVENTKPSLLPNLEQRKEMAKHGRVGKPRSTK